MPTRAPGSSSAIGWPGGRCTDRRCTSPRPVRPMGGGASWSRSCSEGLGGADHSWKMRMVGRSGEYAVKSRYPSAFPGPPPKAGQNGAQTSRRPCHCGIGGSDTRIGPRPHSHVQAKAARWVRWSGRPAGCPSPDAHVVGGQAVKVYIRSKNIQYAETIDSATPHQFHDRVTGRRRSRIDRLDLLLDDQ